MENVKKLLDKWEKDIKKHETSLESKSCGDVESFVKSKHVAQLIECWVAMTLAYLEDELRAQGQKT